MPELDRPEGDLRFLLRPSGCPRNAVGRIIELVKTRIPRRFGLDPIREIQVLCPMNRGGLGACSLNIELQAALNAGEVVASCPMRDRRLARDPRCRPALRDTARRDLFRLAHFCVSTVSIRQRTAELTRSASVESK
jgi:hypothetical protein